MEKIAENTTTVNKKLYYEAMTAADDYRSSALNSIYTLLGAWAILLAYTLMRGVNVIMVFVELGILTLAGLWLLLILPRRKYSKAYYAYWSECGGKMERKTVFYEECCVADGTVLAYKDMDVVKQTKRLLVLRTADKTGVILLLDGFTLGSGQAVADQIHKIREEQCR